MHLNAHVRTGKADPLGRHLEARVGQTKPEGVRRGNAETVEISIADKDAFPVILIGQISIPVTETAGTGVIFIPLGPGGGQAPAGGRFPGEQIRQRQTADVPQLAHQHNRPDFRVAAQVFGVHHTTHVQHHDHCLKGGGKNFQILSFSLRKGVISGDHSAVRTFTRCSCHYIDCAIAIRTFKVRRTDFGHIGVTVGMFQSIQNSTLPLFPKQFHKALHVRLQMCFAGGIIAVQPRRGGDFKPHFPESLLHIVYAA